MNPPEGILLIINEENIADIQAYIQGPSTFGLRSFVQQPGELLIDSAAPAAILKRLISLIDSSNHLAL